MDVVINKADTIVKTTSQVRGQYKNNTYFRSRYYIVLASSKLKNNIIPIIQIFSPKIRVGTHFEILALISPEGVISYITNNEIYHICVLLNKLDFEFINFNWK